MTRPKKRIVIDARESGTTTGRYIDKLIENLHKLKPQHEIIVLTKTHRLEYLNSIAPKFTFLRSDFKEFSIAEQTGLMWQIYRLSPDLVHFSMVQQPVMYLGRVVTTMHDLTTLRFGNPSKNKFVFRFKQYIYGWVNKIAARKSAQVITGSEFVKTDVAKYTRINSRKINVTYEAADVISNKPEAVDSLVAKQFIMYVGRPQPHKNLDRLLDAFKELQTKNPELYLVLAGKKDALYKRHERRVNRDNIDNVVFTDFVSEGQLRWLYEHCGAYVFPSLSEGFGLPGLEAMLHGAPVVSSNATCLPEIYGDAAEYFDPLSVEDMSAKIKKVLTNEKRRKELIKLGKKQAGKYSWQRMATQTLAIYDDILK
jgi:glycosyltransferase involved in cell wall biosynthesis